MVDEIEEELEIPNEETAEVEEGIELEGTGDEDIENITWGIPISFPVYGGECKHFH